MCVVRGGITYAALFLTISAGLTVAQVHAAGLSNVPITQRHANITREQAKGSPKKEAEQKIVNGWPMYRTNRGQEAFNAAMATMKATQGTVPSAKVFNGCEDLHCHLLLPKIDKAGWIAPGRVWVSPKEYVLIVRSPRAKRRKSYRRRSRNNMKLFVFHEFHNSTRNTDVYDTISAHKFSVFVPFYLGKEGVDAYGRKFVVIVQVAPYDVVSRHVSNHGNRGSGVEIAKNKWEKLSPVQEKAGLVLTSIVTQKAPWLRVIHHRHKEGLPMLRAHKRRIAALRKVRRAPKVTLPFVPLASKQVRLVKADLGELITRKGVKRLVRVAKAKPVARSIARTVRKVRTIAVPAPKMVKAPVKRAAVAVANTAPVPTTSSVPAPELVASGTVRGMRPQEKPALTMQSLIDSIFAE